MVYIFLQQLCFLAEPSFGIPLAELDSLACLVSRTEITGFEGMGSSPDVMVVKRSGISTLGGLITIVLFPVEWGGHMAIDLVNNKTLPNAILRQLEKPDEACSIDAKTFYDLIGYPHNFDILITGGYYH